jgi:anti-sigma B factor antagonist
MQISHIYVRFVLNKFVFISFSQIYDAILTICILIRDMETMDMTDKTQGWYIIKVSGDLDLYSAPDLLKKTMDILQQNIKHLHIDLSRISYLDSSGVGTIIKTLQAAKTKSIRLTFSGIQGTPRKVLSMANILPILTEDASPAWSNP